MDTSFSDLVLQEQELLLKLSKESEGWTFVSENEHGKLFSRKVEGCDLDFLKVEAEIPFPMKKFADFVFEKVSDWTEEITKATVKKKLSDNLYILEFYTRVGYMVSDRDFILVSARREDQDKTILISKSVELKDFPVQDGVVRGEVIHSGFVLIPEGENKTKAYYYTQADPKGWIPSWVVNMNGPLMLERLATVKKNLKN